MSNGSNKHLNADYKVLKICSFLIFYLPICEKHNGLDYDKLGNWIEWLKQVSASHIKQGQSIKCHRVRERIDYGEVKIGLQGVEISIFIFPFRVKYQSNYNQNGLQNHKLQTPLFAPPNKSAA
ncbi:SGNH hydrolase-type esterase superfamily protein [Striga asiatica]|uniref:SGNH hydrolase-type esterase superfamily protein n=1 Tax=Striga asiatica TaxID=4170 RepID=A0A5A7QAH7_STRAF|nr:SGNH hydrolase-type esterase superfamily protein [Striga asiatica]